MEKVDLLTKGFVLAPPSRHARDGATRWIRPPVIGTEGQWVLPPLPEKIRTEFAAAAVQLGVRQQPGVPRHPYPWLPAAQPPLRPVLALLVPNLGTCRQAA